MRATDDPHNTLAVHAHPGADASEAAERGQAEAELRDDGGWFLSSSSMPRVLNVVDGTGPFEGHGAHYSRRTPGSATFTGIGKEVVLLHESGRAVWSCVYQSTPSARGTGIGKGRSGVKDPRPSYLWRNNMFRNLGAGLSSALIEAAVSVTYREWVRLYGELPAERLRTEIDIAAVRSRNPGYCYRCAGWEVAGPDVRGKRYLWAPPRPEVLPVVGQMRLGFEHDGNALTPGAWDSDRLIAWMLGAP